MQTADLNAFEVEKSVWPAKVKVAEREAAWMRLELSRVMQGVSVQSLLRECDGFEITVRKPLIARRSGGPAATSSCRSRPLIYA